jgi:hypothetical protein
MHKKEMPGWYDTALQDETYIQTRRGHVRQLIKQALDSPTAEGLASFLDFGTTFRRLSVWNARMAYIQRPGARIVASEYEWKKIERHVLPDAVPIIILWPFSPTRLVYELEDTGPPLVRSTLNDPFAVEGELHPNVSSFLFKSLKSQKSFRISIEYRREGFNKAGSVAALGHVLGDENSQSLWENGNRLGIFSEQNAITEAVSSNRGVPAFRVVISDRLSERERFVTIAHELGHIFLGHLGECSSRSGKEDESGWPDRRGLGKHEREVEAEAVAYLVASRAGIVAASARYLKAHAGRADMSIVNEDLIVRAAARIERLCKISYGSMEFKPRTQ